MWAKSLVRYSVKKRRCFNKLNRMLNVQWSIGNGHYPCKEQQQVSRFIGIFTEAAAAACLKVSLPMAFPCSWLWGVFSLIRVKFLRMNLYFFRFFCKCKSILQLHCKNQWFFVAIVFAKISESPLLISDPAAADMDVLATQTCSVSFPRSCWVIIAVL